MVIITGRTSDLIVGRCKERCDENRDFRSIYEPYLVEKYSVFACIGQEILEITEANKKISINRKDDFFHDNM